ncbi:OLC1v1028941C1 [Oldenlandia corymbosa var. corymbosa]|uniref:OLC1v1028941C1 n=1 Tax=Oldenlandia corymbosa var. corymbosa TaxID=529605 RepID=A0AAV1CCW7_OLDCO|nr:OLC1v1028941C1 [Oldenlandia corymbosa var. corymbosa]
MATTHTASPAGKPKLHSQRKLRRTYFNRAFAAVYSLAILALVYHHVLALIQSKSFLSFSISISMLFADLILAFMWTTTQSYHMNPIVRQVYLENLEKVITSKEDFPGLDIFICTADPYKEPPLGVVNTALSVMAYDYPPEKLSVYVSDDGGSELTLFAFMEAAKFGRSWLPFCKQNNIVDRCPDAYFKSAYSSSSETQNIKEMYEKMRTKIESVMEKGKVTDEYITSEEEHEAFSIFQQESFTRQQHPSVIQVLLESGKDDKDRAGNSMPNLIYISREKSKSYPHHFKAGALNTLLRVSAVMTNAPIVLTLDCDMFSNDPKTVQSVLCYVMDPPDPAKLGYIQFPQMYHGLNKADIYGSEFKPLFQMNPVGMDGIKGPNYVGTGCFFNRRVFFGGPSSFVQPEIPELGPDFTVKEPLDSPLTKSRAHQVAACNYEDQTHWGSKIGFRYGSLVEDYYTGFRLLCEGWHSIFHHPKRPAFLGDIPISLHDVLSQNKRWCVGLLEVAFSKYSTITFGVKSMGFLASHGFTHIAFWPLWSIPITLYAFLPALALLNDICIFPKVSDPWFGLYAFLFLGAYGQECLDFILAGSSFERWRNDQRMWLIKGLTSYTFGTIEYITKIVGIASHGFNVTSKVIDDEQGKRYDQGIFEFGVASPMFVTLSMAAILNMVAFVYGLLKIKSLEGLFVEMFLAGFGVLNSLPIYEAMVLRGDKGKMPTKITLISASLSIFLYVSSIFILKI